jgi:hypothetical protein
MMNTACEWLKNIVLPVSTNKEDAEDVRSPISYAGVFPYRAEGRVPNCTAEGWLCMASPRWNL